MTAFALLAGVAIGPARLGDGALSAQTPKAFGKADADANGKVTAAESPRWPKSASPASTDGTAR
jgi:hypothetical protein